MEKAKNTVSERMLFGDPICVTMCRSNRGQMQKVVQHCELQWTVSFERQFRKSRLKNTNESLQVRASPLSGRVIWKRFSETI